MEKKRSIKMIKITFTTIESKFGLDVESAPEHRQKNINYLKYIVDNLNIKNIANVTLLTLSFFFNQFLILFLKIFLSLSFQQYRL